MRGLLLGIAGVLAGCMGAAAGPPREVVTGWWGFKGIGDDGAEHVFRVLVLPLRNGLQGARISGIVGGAGITRIQPLTASTHEELAMAPAVVGDQTPAIWRWQVEGLDIESRRVRATVEVVIPRLPQSIDPGDPLERTRFDALDLEAHAELHFANGVRAFAKGTPPLEEPIFMDDPYAAPGAAGSDPWVRDRRPGAKR